jgi:thiosulfate/3-mercaptopyruvate sulfurtransferase
MHRVSRRAATLGLVSAFGLAGVFAASPAAAAEPLVQAAWLAAQLGNPHVVVLDIRPDAAYRAGHIPGAVSADYQATGWTLPSSSGAAAALPPVDGIAAVIGGLGVGDADTAVIVGDDFAGTARVYWTFKVLGHAQVALLDGGWKAWTGAVETGPAVRKPAAFTAHYDPGVRALLPEVTAAVANGHAPLVDARPLSHWSGAAQSPVVQAAGHIPGAVSIDQNGTRTADGRLKSADALAALFAPAGDKPAIVYCNTGHAAAADWFVLSEVLHRPGTKLYDGSMSEWTAEPSRPVER